MKWATTASALLLSAIVMVVPPSADAEDPVWFTQLGTDDAGDDREALGSVEDPTGEVGAQVVEAPGADQADIDDVVAVAVAATSTDVLFRLEVAQRPVDADFLLGRFCWVAGFEVEDSFEEYLAVGCTDYEATGTESNHLDARSSRGANVISAMAWDGSAVILTVPHADIGAGPGAVLTDIYALTYMSGSLHVDDPAPDAKSDRDAKESFGSYDLDAGQARAAPAERLPFRIVFLEPSGETFNVTLEFLPSEWVQYRYNWTSPHNEVRFLCEVSPGAPTWTWTTKRSGAEDGGPGMSTLSSEDECHDGFPPEARSVGYEGPLSIVISLRQGSGTFSGQIVPAEPRSTTSTAPPNGPATPGPADDPNEVDPRDLDAPVSRVAPWVSGSVMVLAFLVAAASVMRRAR